MTTKFHSNPARGNGAVGFCCFPILDDLKQSSVRIITRLILDRVDGVDLPWKKITPAAFQRLTGVNLNRKCFVAETRSRQAQLCPMWDHVATVVISAPETRTGITAQPWLIERHSQRFSGGFDYSPCYQPNRDAPESSNRTETPPDLPSDGPEARQAKG